MGEGTARFAATEVEKPQPFNPLPPSTPSKTYHLSSPIIAPYRIRSHAVISSAAPSSFSPAHSFSSSSSSSRRIATAIPADFEFRSLYGDEDYKQHIVHQEPPPPSTSAPLPLQDLLSQLASSVSTMTTAFAQVQACLNTYDIVSHDSMSEGEKAMVVQQLQTLVDLDKGLHALVQQYDMKEGNSSSDQKAENKCTICNGTTVAASLSNVIEKKNAMLASYEGIITRFLDEIRRKDAVTHALKDTLAKSLLRGEKLERRIKALEPSTSTSPSSPSK